MSLEEILKVECRHGYFIVMVYDPGSDPTVKLLTKPHSRSLSLKGGCTGSSESTLVKMSHTLLEITRHGSIIYISVHND